MDGPITAIGFNRRWGSKSPVFKPSFSAVSDLHSLNLLIRVATAGFGGGGGENGTAGSFETSFGGFLPDFSHSRSDTG